MFLRAYTDCPTQAPALSFSHPCQLVAYILPIPPRPLHNLLPDIQRPLGLPPQRPGTRSRSPPPTVHLPTAILVPRHRKLSHGIEKPGVCTLAPDGSHPPPNLS